MASGKNCQAPSEARQLKKRSRDSNPDGCKTAKHMPRHRSPLAHAVSANSTTPQQHMLQKQNPPGLREAGDERSSRRSWQLTCLSEQQRFASWQRRPPARRVPNRTEKRLANLELLVWGFPNGFEAHELSLFKWIEITGLLFMVPAPARQLLPQ